MSERVIQIKARMGDPLPDNPHTREGALRVIRWAAPELTEEETTRVRDLAHHRREPMGQPGLVRCIREVLGADVQIIDANGRPL